MKAKELMDTVTRGCNRVGFGIKKKSPELLIVAGIIGFGSAIVTACIATTKAGGIVEEANDTISVIHEAGERGITESGEIYDDKDEKKDLTVTYIKTGFKFVQLYGPTAVLAASSAICILSSHRILKKRNLALATAYAAVNKSFKDYRGRVLDRFGEQVEKELRYNVKATEIEETVTDDKGKEKKVKKIVDMMEDPNMDPHQISPYAVILDSSHRDWNKDSGVTMTYIRARQAQFTDMLRARGHLLLNDIFDSMGFPRTAVGAVAGWIFDERDPYGDNFVDFRAKPVSRPKPGAEGEEAVYETVYILDFNVKGDILSRLEDHQYI